MLSDLRHALRQLADFPGFSVVSALLCCLLIRADIQAEKNALNEPPEWRATNRTVTLNGRDDGPFIHLDARDGDGFAWLVGATFADGTIDVDIRGANRPGQSFVGIAFHGVDETAFEAVYFRPFNFRNQEALRRSHSVQYISRPQFTWEKLRQDSPGKYEATVSPVPDPDAWFHARIVVAGRQVSVFVNHSPTPSLVVDRLGDRNTGLIGLWVGYGSAGDFANLRIAPSVSP